MSDVLRVIAVEGAVVVLGLVLVGLGTILVMAGCSLAKTRHR